MLHVSASSPVSLLLSFCNSLLLYKAIIGLLIFVASETTSKHPKKLYMGQRGSNMVGGGRMEAEHDNRHYLSIADIPLIELRSKYKINKKPEKASSDDKSDK